MAKYTHITSYKFVTVTECEALRKALLDECEHLQLKGTILLSGEGVNINLAGTLAATKDFQNRCQRYPAFTDMVFKTTSADIEPYRRLRVVIKPEIITFRQDGIEPEQTTVEHLPPTTLKQWLDEGQELVFIDTRNDYELEYGKFANAINLNIEQFTDFIPAVEQLGDQYKQKKVVIYCTGGVRCEKAGPAMKQLGYEQVYQLEGGILNYFAECGQAYYEGDCFVFDDRVAVRCGVNSC